MKPDSKLAANLASVKQRMAEAARRSGRSADGIKLVAVTKYVPVEVMQSLLKLGCCELGESRPQALWEKAAAIGEQPVQWHMVGHLQRNKVERTVPLVSLIHSGDSLRLLQAID